MGDSREVSSVLPVMALTYVRRAVGEAGVAEVLRRCGLCADDPRLTINEWVPLAVATAVADAAGELCGDPNIGHRAGEEYFLEHETKGLTNFILAEGDPVAALEFATTFASRMTVDRQFQVAEHSGCTAMITSTSDHPSRYFCDLCTGYFSRIPGVFGLIGTAVERSCTHLGDERCEFHVRWEPTAAQEDHASAGRRALAEALASFEDLQAMSAELLAAEDTGTVIERVAHRVSLAVMAPKTLVTVRAREHAAIQIASVGFDPVEAESTSDALWACSTDAIPGKVVQVAIESPQRRYGCLAVLLPPGTDEIDLDERFLSVYASNAAAAIDRTESFQDARRNHQITTALLALAGSLASATTVEAVCDRLADAIPDVVGCDVGGVWLWRESDATFQLTSWTDSWVSPGRREIHAADLQGLADLAVNPRPIAVQRTDADPVLEALLTEWGVEEGVAVPIQLRGEFLGMVAASSTTTAVTDHALHERMERLGALADHASTAIDSSRLLEQIRHQALHDPLTGLPNRLLAENRAREAMDLACVEGTGVGLLFVDLDRFKNVNDTLGHSAGDELIRQVADRLRSCVSGDGFVARLGGDEFLVLLPGPGDTTRAVDVANRLIETIKHPYTVQNQQVYISSSVGIACYPEHGEDYSVLMSHADSAMYEAKDYGRSTFAVHAATHTEQRHRRLELESQLHLAVDREELAVLYQPQVDLRTMEIVGVEALVRWDHPTRGRLAPDAFLAMAEESGVIVDIDNWVRRHALAEAKTWSDAGTPIRMALNMSTRDLRNPAIVDELGALMADAGVPPHLVELEITDRVVMSTDDLPGVLHQLRTLGAQLAIDDFGTGNSVLSRLQCCPVDCLKIDRSFISDLAVPEPDTRLVNALISMAHALGLVVVAEGIEDRAQLDVLTRYGCEIGQGYLFSRPVPADRITELLGERLDGARSLTA